MSRTLNLLLVDDNPDDRTLVIRELDREFSALRAEEVTEAKGLARALEQGNFDLVITDYQLRWTDGLTVLLTVKERYPDCPVIMFTGTGNEEIAVEGMKAGLDDYVLKSPKHFRRLPTAVRLALDRARSRRRVREAEARYRDLFDRVPMGLYRMTPSGQILDANPALVRMLGFADQRELRVLSAADLFADPEERRRWQALIDRQGVVRDIDVRFRRRDGKLIRVRSSAQAVEDPEGRVLYYEGTLEDITYRKVVE